MTRETAERILIDAKHMNPGLWVKHSILTAIAAERIASATAKLDPEFAYTAGLLHDIGRRTGLSGIRHITDGYKYLFSLGFEPYANICLSHSFPVKRIESYQGEIDIDEKETEIIQQYFEKVEYDDYDLLMQLCDCIAYQEGYSIIEKRLVDVALRHGINEYFKEKVQGYITIKNMFEKQIGRTVYSLLPGIVAGTFGSEQLQSVQPTDPEIVKCDLILSDKK